MAKQPAELEDQNYKDFYRELYPMQFEEPLFNIHLNVDYPFNLAGILYFPKMSNDMQMQTAETAANDNRNRLDEREFDIGSVRLKEGKRHLFFINDRDQIDPGRRPGEIA